MQKTIVFGVLASLTLMIVAGCGDASSQAATPQQKKDFAGGPMPDDVKKKFQQGQPGQQNVDSIAAKAKAAAGH